MLPPIYQSWYCTLYSAGPEDDSLARSECSKNTFANERTTLKEIEFGNDLVSACEVEGIDARNRSPIARADGVANGAVAISSGSCLRIQCGSSWKSTPSGTPPWQKRAS